MVFLPTMRHDVGEEQLTVRRGSGQRIRHGGGVDRTLRLARIARRAMATR